MIIFIIILLFFLIFIYLCLCWVFDTDLTYTTRIPHNCVYRIKEKVYHNGNRVYKGYRRYKWMFYYKEFTTNSDIEKVISEIKKLKRLDKERYKRKKNKPKKPKEKWLDEDEITARLI